MEIFHSVVIIFTVFSLSNGGNLNKSDIQFATNLSSDLSSALSTYFGDLLKYDDLQLQYRKYPSVKMTSSLEPDSILEQVVVNFAEKLDKGTEALQRNKEFLEKSYRSHDITQMHNLTLCCDQFDSKNVIFGDEIFEEACYNTPMNGKFINPVNARTVFQKNKREFPEGIVQQYFGDSDGNYIQFPLTTDMCNGEQSEDHRFSKWYVFTASPRRKNIVVIIDASGSMSLSIGGFGNTNLPRRIDLAKEAAKTVLDTLSPTDHVGVLSFGDHTKSPTGCLGTHMSKASDHNKNLLKGFIERIIVQNNTYFREAFIEAFKLFTTTKQMYKSQFEDSEDIILLLTDGLPTESPPNKLLLQAIADGQQKMNNSVHIFLYGMGWEILNGNTDQNVQTLMKLADQNNKLLKPPTFVVRGKQWRNDALQWPNFPRSPVGPPGYFTMVNDTMNTDLKKVLGRYYTHLGRTNQTTPTISLPHVKRETAVVTLGLPIENDTGEFIGVAAIDISLHSLLYDIQQFQIGRNGSYIILLGVGGTIVSHPLLNRPKVKEDTRLYYIKELEPSLSVDAVFNITHGMAGLQRFKGNNLQSRSGIFCYRPVPGYEDKFVVILKKLDGDDLKTHYNTSGLGPNPRIVFQEAVNEKVVAGDQNVCLKGNIPVLQNQTVSWFARDITFDQLKNSESFVNLSQIDQNLFENVTEFAAQNGISIGTAIDVFLANQTTNRGDALWRYFGTENGLFQINPGPMLSGDYDPRNDVWYTESIRQNNAFVILRSGNDTVTIARTFYKLSNVVAGVLAADIQPILLNALLTNLLDKCENRKGRLCHILDDKGYIIHESSLVKRDDQKHIMNVLPNIADQLLHIGLLEPVWCEDLISQHMVLSYKLNRKAAFSNTSNVCQNFIMRPINETNLSLLVTQDSLMCNKHKVCSCSNQCISCTTAVRSINCQCPCWCESRLLHTCNNDFNFTSKHKACLGNGKYWGSLRRHVVRWPPHRNWTDCPVSCNSILDAADCNSIAGCLWCSTGQFKSSPLCTKTCVIDRIQYKYTSPCLNFSSTLGEKIGLPQAFVSAYQREIQLFSNIAFTTSNLTSEGFTAVLYTNDGTQIPENVTNYMKSKQITVNCSVCENMEITFYPSVLPFTRLGVALLFRGINFTTKLKTALTLRSFIEELIKNFVLDNLPLQIAETVDNIWPNEDTVTFTLAVPEGYVSQQLSDQTNIFISNVALRQTPIVFNFLGTEATLKNFTTVDGYYGDSCGSPCGQTVNRTQCNIRKTCKWDSFRSRCSSNPFLPERQKMAVYFPCLGLYSNVSTANQKMVVSKVKQKIMSLAPNVTKKATDSFQYKTNDYLIGASVEFIIYGTFKDPPISETINRIKNAIGGDQNFSVDLGSQVYHGEITPREKQHFTDLQLHLTVSGLDFDRMMVASPLTGRQDIRTAVLELVGRYFPPVITKTLSDLWPRKIYLAFTLTKSPANDIDLRLYYNQLQRDVDEGHAELTLGRRQFHVDSIYYQGSFYEICSRNCSEILHINLCSRVPHCGWSPQDGECTDNALLPNKYKMTVLLPCQALHNLSPTEKRTIIKSLTQRITVFTDTHPHRYFTTKNIHSFGFGQVYPSSLTFVIQKSMKSPNLSTMVKDLDDWIASGRLIIDFGTNHFLAAGLRHVNFTNLEVKLIYRQLNFSQITTNHTFIQWVEDDFTRLIMDIFPLDTLVVSGIMMSQNYIQFDITRRKNSSMNLKEIQTHLKDLLTLGGFGVIHAGQKYTPIKSAFQEKFQSNCSLNCTLLTSADDCTGLKKCVWFTEGNTSHCVSDHPLSDRVKLDLFVPCMAFLSMSPIERTKITDKLRQTFTSILGQPGPHVIKSVDITKAGAVVDIQASFKYPHINKYAFELKTNVDYTSGFTFGIENIVRQFSFRDPQDFTNVKVGLTFSTIDFELLKKKYSYEELSQKVFQYLNNILLGALADSFKVTSIFKEVVEFELRKDKTSFISMKDEMSILSSFVKKGKFILDIPFVRTVKATDITISGTFKELCPEKYPVFTTPTSHLPITVLPANASNIQTTQLVMPNVLPSVILVYNQTEVQRSRLQILMESYGLHTCLVEIQQCDACVSSFSGKTCTFHTNDNPIISTVLPKQNKPEPVPATTPSVGDFHIGPVTAVTITVGAIFVLALLIWAAQWLHEATKHKPQKSSSKGESPEPGPSTGREIEELSEN